MNVSTRSWRQNLDLYKIAGTSLDGVGHGNHAVDVLTQHCSGSREASENVKSHEIHFLSTSDPVSVKFSLDPVLVQFKTSLC